MGHDEIHIIGAGPAGCLASLHLSKMGIEHHLIEASTHPRDKACADILTSNAIRELNLADDSILDSLRRQGALQAIWGTVLSVDEFHSADIPYKSLDGQEGSASCFALRRSVLDEHLWSRAIEKVHCHARQGLRVKRVTRNSSHWDIILENDEVEQSYLILLATGSGCAPEGLRSEASAQHTALGIRAYARGVKELCKDRCELFLEERLMPGGFYLAPLPDGLCNINVVIRKDKVQRDQIKLKSLLLELIQKHPKLKERFRDAEIIGSVQGAPLELATTKRDIVEDGLMRIGDAAGLIDLISANGIPQALLSARLAAERTGQALAANDMSAKYLNVYAKTLEKEIVQEVRLGRFLSPALSYPLLCRWTLKGMKGIMGDSEESLFQSMLYSEKPLKTLLKGLSPV